MKHIYYTSNRSWSTRVRLVHSWADSHLWIMCDMTHSHVITYVNEWRHCHCMCEWVTYEWHMSIYVWMSDTYTYVWRHAFTHMWMSDIITHNSSHVWISHITHTNESRHAWMYNVTRMNESCLTYECVMSHTWMSHVTHTRESCYTCEWVTWHIWKSHVTHINV